MAESSKTLVELQEEIYELGGKFYTDRIDLKLEKDENKEKIINEFKTLKNIGGYEITDIDTKDGVKLMLGENSKILVRPSGTEPLLRIYFESDSVEKLNDIMQKVKIIIPN